METRYKMLTKSHPHQAEILMEHAQEGVKKKFHYYEQLAALKDDNEEAK